MKVGEIRKALTPLVTGGLGWATLIVASPSAPITAPEWIMGGSILATSLGVYAITNAPSTNGSTTTVTTTPAQADVAPVP